LQESSTGDRFLKNCLKLFLLLLLAIPAFGFGQQDPDSKLALLLTTAQQAQAKGAYTAAADSYKQATKIRPDVPELWANLGLMEHEAGNYGESIRALQEANRLKPSLYVPNLFLGIDYVKTGKPKEALQFLIKAERLNSKDPQVPLELGHAYSSLKQPYLAAREFTRTITLNPQQSSAWFALGISYLDEVEADARKMSTEDKDSVYANALFAESLAKQSRYKESRDLYKTILVSKVTPPCMHSELGWVYLKQHDIAAATSEFKAELQSQQQCSLASVGQAQILIDNGSNAEALTVLKFLWDRDRGSLQADSAILTDGLASDRLSSFLEFITQQHSLGVIPQDLYDMLSATEKDSTQIRSQKSASPKVGSSPKEAADKLYKVGRYEQCAERLKPGLISANESNLLLLANCSYWTRDYDLSSKASAQLLAKVPHSVEGLYWSIKANERLAFRSLEQFERLEPNSATNHILFGDIWRQRRQYSEAEAEYLKALELSSNNHAALLGLASAYYSDGDTAKVIETTREALALSPDDPELNLLMAEALISGYKFTDAEAFLKKSLTVKPQMLPHVHALLGDVYAKTGRSQEAIKQLKMGLESDDDGHIHYLLARLYRDSGDTKDANAALEQMKTIRQESRERYAIFSDDTNSSSAATAP
jgi:tetratricopeptide (TPR) repeat protein